MTATKKQFGVRLDLENPGRSAWTPERLAELGRACTGLAELGRTCTGIGAAEPEQLAAMLRPPLEPTVQPPRRLPARVQVALEPLRVVALEPLKVELVTPAPSPPQPQKKGGPKPSAIPIEILIKASAWLGHWGVPETLAEVERKIHDLLAEAGRSAGETTVRRWATKLVDEHRREADREGP
jgi:hypothetical protein